MWTLRCSWRCSSPPWWWSSQSPTAWRLQCHPQGGGPCSPRIYSPGFSLHLSEPWIFTSTPALQFWGFQRLHHHSAKQPVSCLSCCVEVPIAMSLFPAETWFLWPPLLQTPPPSAAAPGFLLKSAGRLLCSILHTALSCLSAARFSCWRVLFSYYSLWHLAGVNCSLEERTPLGLLPGVLARGSLALETQPRVPQRAALGALWSWLS